MCLENVCAILGGPIWLYTSGPKSYKSLLNLSLNLSAIFEMAIHIGKIFYFK